MKRDIIYGVKTVKYKSGMRWGYLTLIDNLLGDKGLFECACGHRKVIRLSHVTRSKTRSCGCKKAELKSASSGKLLIRENGKPIKEYGVWKGMRSRCNNPNNKYFNIYGGRGISVCKEWDDFATFIADIGRRPSDKHSIDRIDSNGNYEPGNCRWATSSEQAINRRNNVFYTYEGRTKTISEWSRELNVKNSVFWEYLQRHGIEKSYRHFKST